MGNNRSFAYSFQYQGVALVADPVGNESLHDAMLRVIEQSTGSLVSECGRYRRIDGKWGLQIALANGECADAVIGRTAT